MQHRTSAMFYTFCYAQCRSQPLLNHTDARALDVCRYCGALALVWFSEHLHLLNMLLYKIVSIISHWVNSFLSFVCNVLLQFVP